jgi:non-ribosomal peptide synthetase component F
VSDLLQDWLVDAAQRTPEATALVLGDERMTYAEVDTFSTRVARQLRAAGCDTGDRVCLALDKSPATIAGMLGVLKAGCLYVPVDTQSPPARQAKIYESCEPRVVLTEKRAAASVSARAIGRTPTRPPLREGFARQEAERGSPLE